jgi:hypothetical protein
MNVMPLKVRAEIAESRVEWQRKLLDLYRLKRSVDGLNGRPWWASKHLEYEEDIADSEGEMKLIILRDSIENAYREGHRDGENCAAGGVGGGVDYDWNNSGAKRRVMV